MPYTIERHKQCFSVVNKQTGQKKSKCTTKSKAMKQMHLLQGVEHGWTPSKKKGRGIFDIFGNIKMGVEQDTSFGNNDQQQENKVERAVPINPQVKIKGKMKTALNTKKVNATAMVYSNIDKPFFQSKPAKITQEKVLKDSSNVKAPLIVDPTKTIFDQNKPVKQVNLNIAPNSMTEQIYHKGGEARESWQWTKMPDIDQKHNNYIRLTNKKGHQPVYALPINRMVKGPHPLLHSIMDQSWR